MIYSISDFETGKRVDRAATERCALKKEANDNRFLYFLRLSKRELFSVVVQYAQRKNRRHMLENNGIVERKVARTDVCAIMFVG